MQTLSVYVHVPFCRRKCAYCDFVSFAGAEEKIRAYTEAVCSEIREQAGFLSPPPAGTVYFGGGTPSVLPAEEIRRMLDALRASFPVREDAEISLEANPESVTPEKAEAWRRMGFNRVSLGVQSFLDGELSLLGRIHRAEDARRAVRTLRLAGFRNLNVDLMYALPGQRASDWARSLETVSALRPEHLSCYQLILEEGTPMTARVASGAAPAIPDEDEILEMDLCTARAADACGLERYEVSNYAAPGFACRHNLAYWECLPYAAFGCAAHADTGRRARHTENLSEYLSGPAGRRLVPEGENTPAERRFERIMMGLRMTRGVDLVRFRRDFGGGPGGFWPESWKRMRENGWLRETETRAALTPAGMAVMNPLLVAMMEEQDAGEGRAARAR